MTTWTIVRKTLRDSRGLTVGMAIAVGLVAFFDVLLYPSYAESLQDFEMPDYFKGFIGEASSWGTPEGFLSTEFFSWAPILAIIAGGMAGSFAFAGEEADGTLDLLVAQPIKRWQLAFAKIVAISMSVSVILAAGIPGFFGGTLFAEIDLSLSRFVAATFNTVPLVALFLGLTLLGSALLPSRGSAILAPIAIVVITFFIQMMTAAVPSIESLRVVSPFYWAESSRVLLHGFDWLRSSTMMGIACVEYGLAIWALERREVAQGGREVRLIGGLRRRMRRPVVSSEP
ncbi:MAG: ABC transporter permease subunit [Thermomicrobiales bacterium]|nr:ABC transporter permease subunit [Thermomicrobiales bacterium]